MPESDQPPSPSTQETTPPPPEESPLNPTPPPASAAASGSPEQTSFAFFEQLPELDKTALAQSMQTAVRRLQTDLNRLLTGSYEPQDDSRWHPDCETLQPTDVLLTFDVRGYNAAGEILRIITKQTMAGLVEPAMLPEAYRNVEASLFINIIRPLLVNVMRYLNTFVEHDGKPLPKGTRSLLGTLNVSSSFADATGMLTSARP